MGLTGCAGPGADVVRKTCLAVENLLTIANQDINGVAKNATEKNATTAVTDTPAIGRENNRCNHDSV